ncbi:hypothetical protein Prum_079930 [Phytohabitans rumicis]|uniref:Heparinase II/III-like C-terminal domain-containing protein n=1 Tax=Phytohabitans rumicis TaxID=1076125 RepID=A0A6V8LHJ1_9ACTN|nr:hypothetical protein Prum_079930 [Phytohabitans rumicis]
MPRHPATSLARELAALFDPPPSTGDFPYVGREWLPDTEVLVVRERPGRADGLFLAAKGGHNAENHNHNDVGTFIVALDGRPVLVDAGVGRYTRQTFSDRRYEIWTMRSTHHNVPEMNGREQAPAPPTGPRTWSARAPGWPWSCATRTRWGLASGRGGGRCGWTAAIRRRWS